MVDKIHEKNDDDDDDDDLDDENTRNKFDRIVNAFLFDDTEELEDNNMDKVREKILDYSFDLWRVDVRTKKV